MPKPIPKSIAVAEFGMMAPAFLGRRSAAMIQIGIIACMAAKIDDRLLDILTLLMGTDAKTAQTVFDGIINQETRLSVLRKFAKKCQLPDALYKELNDVIIQKKLKSARQARTTAVHTNWLTSEELPDSLISGGIWINTFNMEWYEKSAFLEYSETDFRELLSKIDDCYVSLTNFAMQVKTHLDH